MTALKTIADLLGEHPFTREMPADLVNTIAGCGSNRVFRAGDYLFREGDPADTFYLIRAGSVALQMHRPGAPDLVFHTLGGGEMLGANWLVPPYRCPFDALARETTRTLAFDARCLRDKCEADNALGYQLMKCFLPPLLERLHGMRLQAADLYGTRG